MNLEQTLDRWKQIKRLADSGVASTDDRAFFRKDADGYRLCAMRVDAETLDQLLAIAAQAPAVRAELESLKAKAASGR